MRYERVLLVNPPSRGEWRGIRPHIGLGYLTESLQNNDIEHDVLDMNLGYKFRHLSEKIRTFQPDLIGMTLLILEHRKFYGLISQIKKLYPKIKVVVGGPHVTIMKEQVLKDCTDIDYGIVYEGEQALIELCKGRVSLDKIGSLIFREDHVIHRNSDREFIQNLDELPFPRYEKFELEKYIHEADIYSSRGCPHQCIFCPNRIISPVFRARSPENVVDEMQYWYEQGYRQFNFDDDNFNLVRERVFQICDEIEKRGMKGLFLRCSNGIRADRMDRELLARMREVGFKYIAFGVDAGNDRMLKVVKKGETMAQIKQTIRDACDLGYDIKLLFVVGTPRETREDIEDKVRLSKKYPIQDVHFYNTIPYPGTELYDWIEKKDYFLRKPEDYLNDVSCLEDTPVFETPELSGEERKRVFKYLKKVQNQVHRKTIQRMFREWGIFGPIAGYIFANKLAKKLFYQNVFIRKVVEGLRYRKALMGKGKLEKQVRNIDKYA